jgi:nucleoside phosphorylase
MESYSVFYAAQNSTDPKPKAIVIKSICDFADSEKSDKYQKFAAYTSSQFAKYLYEKHLPYE